MLQIPNINWITETNSLDLSLSLFNSEISKDNMNIISSDFKTICGLLSNHFEIIIATEGITPIIKKFLTSHHLPLIFKKCKKIESFSNLIKESFILDSMLFEEDSFTFKTLKSLLKNFNFINIKKNISKEFPIPKVNQNNNYLNSNIIGNNLNFNLSKNLFSLSNMTTFSNNQSNNTVIVRKFSKK